MVVYLKIGYAKNYIVTNIRNSDRSNLDGSNLISDGKTEKVKMRKVGEQKHYVLCDVVIKMSSL